MVTVQLKKLTTGPKKYQVTFPGGAPTVKFGARGYSDYTVHKDPARMQRYLTRHRSRENWSDPKTPGFWSRWLLWSVPTLSGAKSLIKKKFGLTVR
jgi:hypothetical protein